MAIVLAVRAHIATVHWQSDYWIEPQRQSICRYVDDPSVYAFVHDIPNVDRSQFEYCSSEPIGDHATKLNLLADIIGRTASDEDVLVFIDGDALLLAPLERLVERLAQHNLIAAQRLENDGDIQPHPCFCVTTVGFWKEIAGDWHRGYSWRDLHGNEVSDVGGNLLGRLTERGVAWLPLLRLNRKNPHPVLFAIYGDQEPIVYHHGAGFRRAAVRKDLNDAGYRQACVSRRARLLDKIPRRVPGHRLRDRIHPARQIELRAMAKADALSSEWKTRLGRDPDSWRDLL